MFTGHVGSVEFFFDWPDAISLFFFFFFCENFYLPGASGSLNAMHHHTEWCPPGPCWLHTTVFYIPGSLLARSLLLPLKQDAGQVKHE